MSRSERTIRVFFLLSIIARCLTLEGAVARIEFGNGTRKVGRFFADNFAH